MSLGQLIKVWKLLKYQAFRIKTLVKYCQRIVTVNLLIIIKSNTNMCQVYAEDLVVQLAKTSAYSYYNRNFVESLLTVKIIIDVPYGLVVTSLLLMCAWQS